MIHMGIQFQNSMCKSSKQSQMDGLIHIGAQRLTFTSGYDHTQAIFGPLGPSTQLKLKPNTKHHPSWQTFNAFTQNPLTCASL